MIKCRQQLFYWLFIAAISGCATDGARFYDSAYNDKNRAPASLAIPTNYDHEKVPTIDNVHNQAEADFLFIKSDMESQAGRPAESIELLKSTLVYDPEAPTVMQKLAIEYYKKGQYRDSIYWSEKALAKEPKRRDLVLLTAGLYTTTKNYTKAEQLYTDLIKKDKDDTEAKLYLGAVYSETKNYKKAIAQFQDLTRHPSYSTKHLAHYYLARVYLEQGGKDSSYLAQKQLKDSIKIKSDYFDSISLLAQLIQKESCAEKAFQFYIDLQKKHGPQVKIAEILSQYYIEKNKYDLAYEQLEILDSYSDDLLQVKLKMALILIDKKSYEPAIVKLKEILQTAPESDKVRFYLSAVYEEKKEYQNAFDEYVKISSTSSYFEESRLHAAYLAKNMGQMDLAIKVLNESFKAKSDNPQTYFLMAQFHEEQNNLSKALEVLNVAENKFPNNAQVLFYKGTIQDKMNLKNEMISSMKKVLVLEKEHVQAMNYLAFSWAEMNIELDQAEKYARLAVAKEKEDAFILDTLGWVLFKKGNYKEAVDVLEKAHSMQPSVGIIAEHLGDIYIKTEKFEKAKMLFERAVQTENDLDKKQDIQQKINAAVIILKERKPASINQGD